MALGLMPYMASMIISMLAFAIIGKEMRSRVSPRKRERLSFILTVIIALIQARSRADELTYVQNAPDLIFVKAVVIIEMVAMAVALQCVLMWNQKRGLGGMMPVMIVNLIDTLIRSLAGVDLESIQMLLFITFVGVVVTLIMEIYLVKIPVQRVSIHNEYADKNYIAYKLNPIGLMPIMFATAIFTLLKLLFELINNLLPNVTLESILQVMDLSQPVGVLIYLGVVLLLTLSFAMLMLSPGSAAEDLQKGGDSIVGVYAGKPTARFLRLRLLAISLLSAFVMIVFMGLSLMQALNGTVATQIAMLPSTAMMLVSFFCTIVIEISSYRRFDSYKPFI